MREPSLYEEDYRDLEEVAEFDEDELAEYAEFYRQEKEDQELRDYDYVPHWPREDA